MSVIGPLSLLAAYAACVGLVLVGRRRPLAVAAVIGAAVLVCLVAITVHTLSAFHAVGRPGLLAGNAAITLLGAAVVYPHRHELRRLRWPVFRLDPFVIWVAALGLLVLVSAVAYRPNNWDSMTYHLARVAHWMQNRSVEAYPTNITRQVAYPPGAEYLLLVLQATSGSERYANLLQFWAWILLAVSAPVLARTFGTPRGLCRWSVLFVAATPMALMQASSTQNDLVSALISVSIVFACLPFFHKGHVRWRWPDCIFLLASVTAGLAVKPTSVIVTTPFLVLSTWSAIRSFRQHGALPHLLRALPALILVVAVLAPVVAARSAIPEDRSVTTPFLYLNAGELSDRLANSLRGLARNIPAPPAFFDRVFSANGVGCARPNSLCLDHNLIISEDLTGSIGAALVLVFAMLFGAARWGRLSQVSRAGLLSVFLGWLLLHAIFRDNVWITRLQLPLFAMLPLTLGVFRAQWLTRGWGAAAFWLLLVFTAAHATVAATLNPRRPVDPAKIFEGRSAQAYYTSGPLGVAETHDATLHALEQLPCRRLGLFIGANSYDYPLTWRAMRRGWEVRYLVGPDDWPCAVFSDQGPPPPRPTGDAWLTTGSPFLFVAPAAK